MNYEWLDEYCLTKPGAVKEFQEEWGVHRYMVGGKMFGMNGEDNKGRNILTWKCEPSFGEFLRDMYEDIVSGYYMNKVHWNSVYVDGKVPDGVLQEMIDQSYELIFKGLTKKVQKEILANGE